MTESSQSNRTEIPESDIRSIPRLATEPVHRHALCRQFDRANSIAGGVVLVSGMAGTGKTVAISEWLRCSESPEVQRAIAWTTLSDEHNDISIFWNLLLESLAEPEVYRSGQVADGTTPWSGAEIVARSLENLSTPTVLVLDDLHTIHDPLTLAGLGHLLEILPSQVTFVLASRFPPAIPWHRLDLTGTLTRIDGDDLSFDVNQISEVLAAADVQATDDDLDMIVAVTGGWAALVRMVALLLSTEGGDRRVLPSIAASGHPAISDFLAGELLDTISDELRDFLILTAVPDELDLDLATELAGPDAPRLLAEILDRQFPLLHTGTGSSDRYRYHPMMRAHLRSELDRRLGRDHAQRLELQVGRWYSARRTPVPAIRHLLAARDRYELSKCVLDLGPKAVLGPRGHAFLQALDNAPSELAEDPFVHLLHCVHALYRNRQAEAAAFLQSARNRSSSICPTDLFERLCCAVDIDIQSRLAQTVTIDALPTSVNDHPDIESYVAVQQAKLMLSTGEAMVTHQLHLAVSKAEHSGSPRPRLESLTLMALIDGANDRFASMRAHALAGVRFAEAAGLTETGDANRCAVMCRYYHFLSGTRTSDIIDASVSLTVGADGLASPAAGWDWYTLSNLLMFQDSTDKVRAAREIAESTRAALTDLSAHPLAVPIIPLVAHALVVVHELESARRIIEMATTAFGPQPEIAVATATLELAQGRTRKCPGIIDAVLSQPAIHLTTAVQARLMRSILRSDAGNESGAFSDLDTAIALAEPQQLIQPFLLIDRAVSLLDQHIGKFGRRNAFVDQVRTRPDAVHTPTSVILTPAEMRVLQQLPSSRTTQEIAETLVLSINTVKTHLRGIYGKFGVVSRRDAITAARMAGML